MRFFKPDEWSTTHFFGSGWLVFFFYTCLEMELLISGLFAGLLGVLWEMLDTYFKLSPFDSRGGDFGDMVFDFAGVIFVVGLIWILT